MESVCHENPFCQLIASFAVLRYFKVQGGILPNNRLHTDPALRASVTGALSLVGSYQVVSSQ